MFWKSLFHISIPLVKFGLATPGGLRRVFEHCFARASFSLPDLFRVAYSLLALQICAVACLILTPFIIHNFPCVPSFSLSSLSLFLFLVFAFFFLSVFCFGVHSTSASLCVSFMFFLFRFDIIVLFSSSSCLSFHQVGLADPVFANVALIPLFPFSFSSFSSLSLSLVEK